ncbi:unnamed protein product [Peronospora belbahrii]|uniref:Protein kinase domain-containing protein n=1 Tax=Peronospora belbahrii TaxID=622444 RepID=A0ABN8CNS0_9STRA|nr:unnamed protein product [Peronospora belbahrii]
MSQCTSSAGSSDLDNVRDAQVQQFPATEITIPSFDKIDGTFFSYTPSISSYPAVCASDEPCGLYTSGYLQHYDSNTAPKWQERYCRLEEKRLLCYKKEKDRTLLFQVNFTRNSVLLYHKEASDDHVVNQQQQHATNQLVETTKSSLSLYPAAVHMESMTFLLDGVEICGHSVIGQNIEIPVRFKTEKEGDYVTWITCFNDVIQRRERDALVQVTVETSQSDSDVENMELPIALRKTSKSTTLVDSPKRRILDMNGQEGAKMPRQTSSALAGFERPMESQSLVNVETYETFRSRYLLMKEIGEGSFSIVHRAVNRLTGHVCAVKCCKVSQALEEEERLLRTLSHPNVVSLEGVFERNKNLHYVVMDYLKDGDMCDQLIKRQRLPEPEVRRIIRQVVEGLAYLHRRCVLHRDIKPENILIHGNMVKIADFGLAKELEQPTTLLQRSCGTLEYAAPELLCGQPYGLKSDVFSLGIVLYVLLFGSFPFSVETAAALKCMDPFPTDVDVRDMSCLSSSNVQWRIISPLAQDALLKMLKTNDAERISAEDLLGHPWFNDTMAGMSKSISCTPDELEHSRIEDCEAMGFAELLSRGFRVIKYGNKESTMPYVALLSLNFMEERINWTAHENPLPTEMVKDTSKNTIVCCTGGSRGIFLRDIKEIREGHTTKAFLSHNNIKSIPPPELCLSIICPWRTLDLAVEAPSQREFMVRGLRRLTASHA